MTELIRESVIIYKGKDLYTIDKQNALTSHNIFAADLLLHSDETIHYRKLKSVILSHNIDNIERHSEFENIYDSKKRSILLPVWLTAFALLRIIQGIQNNKPVTYLVMIAILSGIILIFIFRANNFHNTCARIFRKDKSFTNNINNDVDSGVIFSGIAGIFGIIMLSHLQSGYFDFERRYNDGSGGSSCGGGSGGSCGGGCGGCGGD